MSRVLDFFRGEIQLVIFAYSIDKIGRIKILIRLRKYQRNIDMNTVRKKEFTIKNIIKGRHTVNSAIVTLIG